MSYLPSQQHRLRAERGFVLVTVLVMLALLTLLSLTMYFSGRVATQSSGSAQVTTESYYYAETAVNYMAWAINNDAEFDSHVYTGTYVHGPFAEPALPANAASVGDYKELRANLWNPGPTQVNSDSGYGITGQVKYFDNSPMNARAICFQSAASFANCADVTLSHAVRYRPTMYHISAKLPRYIKLDIASDGTISPSIPKLPHRNPPQVEHDQHADGTYDHNGDIPKNGAIVWLTAGDSNNLSKDIEIFPLETPTTPPTSTGFLAPSACDGGSSNACPCTAPAPLNNANDPNYAPYWAGQACDATSGQWLPSYSIVAYAIGYVNGRPSHLLRAVIK